MTLHKQSLPTPTFRLVVKALPTTKQPQPDEDDDADLDDDADQDDADQDDADLDDLDAELDELEGSDDEHVVYMDEDVEPTSKAVKAVKYIRRYRRGNKWAYVYPGVANGKRTVSSKHMPGEGHKFGVGEAIHTGDTMHRVKAATDTHVTTTDGDGKEHTHTHAELRDKAHAGHKDAIEAHKAHGVQQRQAVLKKAQEAGSEKHVARAQKELDRFRQEHGVTEPKAEPEPEEYHGNHENTQLNAIHHLDATLGKVPKVRDAAKAKITSAVKQHAKAIQAAQKAGDMAAYEAASKRLSDQIRKIHADARLVSGTRDLKTKTTALGNKMSADWKQHRAVHPEDQERWDDMETQSDAMDDAAERLGVHVSDMLGQTKHDTFGDALKPTRRRGDDDGWDTFGSGGEVPVMGRDTEHDPSTIPVWDESAHPSTNPMGDDYTPDESTPSVPEREKTLYEHLDVAPNATADEIKAAYRTAVKEYHPDKGGNPETIKRINAAHDILKDEGLRAKYDETGDLRQVRAHASRRVKKALSMGVGAVMLDKTSLPLPTPTSPDDLAELEIQLRAMEDEWDDGVYEIEMDGDVEPTSKAMGNFKYIRRYRKGNRWAYVYAKKTGHVDARHLVSKDHPHQVGEAHMVEGGKHAKVVGVDGDHLHIEVDGQASRIHKDDLHARVHAAHAPSTTAYVQDGVARREALLASARAVGSAPHIQRAERELAKFKAAHGVQVPALKKEELPPAPAPAPTPDHSTPDGWKQAVLAKIRVATPDVSSRLAQLKPEELRAIGTLPDIQRYKPIIHIEWFSSGDAAAHQRLEDKYGDDVSYAKRPDGSTMAVVTGKASAADRNLIKAEYQWDGRPDIFPPYPTEVMRHTVDKSSLPDAPKGQPDAPKGQPAKSHYEVDGNEIHIYSPYSETIVETMKGWGGKWDRGESRWVLPKTRLKAVQDLMGEDPSDTVYARVDKWRTVNHELMVGLHPLARREKKHQHATLHADLLEGVIPSSGGSGKNPAVEPSRAVFGMWLPRSLAIEKGYQIMEDPKAGKA